jgi:group I intron endonuclease
MYKEMMFHIYCYENKMNGKIYIGQTNNIVKRKSSHITDIRGNMPIDKAIRKYGIQNFDFNVLKIVDTHFEADQEEIFWIAEMRRILGENNVYNISDGGTTGMLGKKCSDEHKQKVSAALKGKAKPPRTEEHSKNLSRAQMGKSKHNTPHTDETKLKISLAFIGKTWVIEDGKRVWKDKV